VKKRFVKLSLALGLALCAFASPAVSGPQALLPYCWNVDNTQCSSLGQTKRCTDGIWSDYVCTCREYYISPTQKVWRWDCPEVR
jgi:hypothetical protein